MYASVTRLGWALPVVAAAVGGCADPPNQPFPENQCAYLESLDTSGCETAGGDCLKVVCVRTGVFGFGCPDAERSSGLAYVDRAAIDAFVGTCEARGRCVNDDPILTTCFGDTGYWTDAGHVLECFEPPCGYPKW